MTQPVGIQRLEEAVDSLTSFEGESKAAREPLDQLVERVDSLTELVESEGEKTRGAIEEATDTLSELRARLEEAGQQARGHTEAVSTKAGELGGEAGSALVRVKELLATLGAARESLLTAVADGAQVTLEECQQVASQVETIQGEMNQGLESALQGIEAFQTEVGETRVRLVENRSRWEEALSHLESLAQQRTSATLENLRHLFARFTQSFVEAKNEVIDQHNETMSQLWDNLAEEIPSELEPLFGSLTETIEALEALRAAHVATVQSACSQVADQARHLAGTFDGLRADLGQSISRLPSG